MEIKRGRGRPRKDAPAPSTPKEEINVKRGRGRPKKVITEIKDEVAEVKVLQVKESKAKKVLEPTQVADLDLKWTILMQGYSQRAYELAKPNLRKVALLCATTKAPFLVIKNEITKAIKVHVFNKEGEYLSSSNVNSEEEAKAYALCLSK